MSTVAEEWGMKCPECGSDEFLDVCAKIYVRLVPDGTDADEQQDSECLCASCDWVGLVADARKAYEEDDQ